MFGKTRHIHFVGIGGIGMSGMAELLNNLSFVVSGSDLAASDRTKHLKSIGIDINIGHSSNQVLNSDVVVFSSAVNQHNPEIVTASENNIPVIRRAELLGELLKVKSTSIAVSGTHGKTSTSSMLGCILSESNLNPTLVIGGIVNEFGSNSMYGDGDIIVVEADEFDRSFLSLQPTMALITNLDLEHLDCYENMEDLQNCFAQFANSVPFYGKVALNIDNENTRQLISLIKRPIMTFGFSSDAEIQADNTNYETIQAEFDLIVDNDMIIKIQLNVPGKHNISNALGAIALAWELGISPESIQSGLSRYSGVWRRFEIKHKLENGTILIDDYAHHPSEVEAALDAVKLGWDNRVVAIFQPHLYTRTRDFHQEFAKAFMNADVVIITELYPARETPIEGISGKLITEDLKKLGHHQVIFVPEKENIPKTVEELINPGDVVITMGAGDIWRQVDNIYNVLN